MAKNKKDNPKALAIISTPRTQIQNFLRMTVEHLCRAPNNSEGFAKIVLRGAEKIEKSERGIMFSYVTPTTPQSREFFIRNDYLDVSRKEQQYGELKKDLRLI